MKVSNKSLPVGRRAKISVIMSVYNGIPYLKSSIESILHQSYRNFEFIIVDDASKDQSPKYLKSLKDKRIKIIQNKKNIGLAASLNKAIKASTGTYIARMDADDISLKNRFKEQIKFLLKNPSIDLCGTWVDTIDENDKIIGEKKYPTSPKKVKNSLSLYTAVVHSTFMGKKSFFDNLGGYDPKFDFAEDYDLLMRGRMNYKITNIPKKLLMWRFQNRRRSRSKMVEMDNADLAIKMNSLKRDGLELILLAGLARKIILKYLIPPSLKLKLAVFLKVA